MVLSKIYANGKVNDLYQLYECQPFFRKMTDSQNEFEIAKLIMESPCANIVKIYRITDTYIDMELLKPVSNMFRTRLNLGLLRRDMLRAKIHLQKIGIMYIDWKYDNVGLDSKGHYKLFDFDASGIINADGIWVRRPEQYNAWLNAVKTGFSDPKEIDNYVFSLEL